MQQQTQFLNELPYADLVLGFGGPPLGSAQDGEFYAEEDGDHGWCVFNTETASYAYDCGLGKQSAERRAEQMNNEIGSY